MQYFKLKEEEGICKLKDSVFLTCIHTPYFCMDKKTKICTGNSFSIKQMKRNHKDGHIANNFKYVETPFSEEDIAITLNFYEEVL